MSDDRGTRGIILTINDVAHGTPEASQKTHTSQVDCTWGPILTNGDTIWIELSFNHRNGKSTYLLVILRIVGKSNDHDLPVFCTFAVSDFFSASVDFELVFLSFLGWGFA